MIVEARGVAGTDRDGVPSPPPGGEEPGPEPRRMVLFSVAVFSTMFALQVLHVVASLLLLPRTLLRDPDRRTSARLGAWLARSALGLPRRWRGPLEELRRVDLRRPAVVVANHRSIVDIGGLLCLPGAPRLLAKPWVARLPLVGLGIRLSGHVVFDPADLGQVRGALDRMEGMLRRGISVGWFPEGTRQRSPGLGPFGEGAFELALRAGVDVLPIVFHGTGELVPPGSLVFRDVPVGATVLPRIPAEGDRRALAMRVRSAMEAALASGLPAVTG